MQLVTTPSELDRACSALRGHHHFYIDTEFESSRRGCKLSLVQLSVVPEARENKLPGDDDIAPDIYLFDALALQSLKPLAPIVAAPEAEWILHAGLQDIDLLGEALELDTLPQLFDTQVGWALLSPEAGVALSYLEYRVLGLKNMKTHQTDDWMRRPLPRRQLEYAAADVLHLPRIEYELTRRAQRLGRRDIILQASRNCLLPEQEPVKHLSLRSFRNAWQLAPKNQIALLGLIELFNRLNEDSHVPLPAAKGLLSIASRMPTQLEDLRRIKGVPQAFTRRHGREVLQCLASASDTSRLSEVEALAPPAYASFEEVHVEAWLGVMRSDVCSRLGVSAEFALPNKLLRQMRDQVLDHADWSACTTLLEGWRRDLLLASVTDYVARRDLPLTPPPPIADLPASR